MKVIFFPDLQDHTSKLRDALKKHQYTCIQSTQQEEYNQLWQQAGKFVIIFSDAKAALNLMKNLTQWMTGVQYRVYAFMNTKAKFTAESQKILTHYKITAFTLDQGAELMAEVNKYFTTADSDVDNIDDIQFLYGDGTEKKD